MCLHTCSRHAARVTDREELWSAFCIPTGSAGPRRTPPTQGGAGKCPEGPLRLHAPAASTLCPATGQLSLQHRVDCGLSCSQPFRGSSCSSDKARCPRSSGPPFRPVSGSQPPPSTAVLCMDSGLKHRAQPWHLWALSVCLHAPSFSLSFSLVLATWLEPSLPSPLSHSPFSAFQHLLCPLRSFQGLQPPTDARAGPVCPARGCDPGTTTRPRGGERWLDRSRSGFPG